MKVLSIFLTLILGVFPFRSGGRSAEGGEEQVFVVHYQWGLLNADVARITASCESTSWHGIPACKARIYGKTAKFCEAIVKVREDFQSTFTSVDFRPVKSSRKAQEAKFNGGETYKYDWEGHTLEMSITGKSSEKKKSFELEEGLLDIPTLYYAVRSMDFEQAADHQPFNVRLAVGDNVETLIFRYDGIETVNARGVDKVKAHKISIGVTSGNTFDTKDSVVVYLTDDEYRVPLYFEAPMVLGKVTGRLESSTAKK